jgi:hypothetical protein
MKIQATNKNGQIVVQFDSADSRNIATNKAIDLALKVTNFFAVYVDGKLDCFSESSDHFAFPKVLNV